MYILHIHLIESICIPILQMVSGSQKKINDLCHNPSFWSFDRVPTSIINVLVFQSVTYKRYIGSTEQIRCYFKTISILNSNCVGKGLDRFGQPQKSHLFSNLHVCSIFRVYLIPQSRYNNKKTGSLFFTIMHLSP